jgi:hypothetical protein
MPALSCPNLTTATHNRLMTRKHDFYVVNGCYFLTSYSTWRENHEDPLFSMEVSSRKDYGGTRFLQP